MTWSVDIIRQAICERRQLEFGYHGYPRVVEPMALGVGHSGSWKLRAHQVGGRSSTGRVGDGTPKLFEIADMSDLAMLTINFTVPIFYSPGDRAFTRIEAEL